MLWSPLCNLQRNVLPWVLYGSTRYIKGIKLIMISWGVSIGAAYLGMLAIHNFNMCTNGY
jgi:hypothetical protein